MIKAVKIVLVALLLWGCQKQKKYDTGALNGYWEIEKVQFPDGSEKLYNYNPIIDHFSIKDSVGIRKKVQPQLDGTFLASKDIKKFTLRQKNDSLYLYYKTAITAWKETITHLDTKRLLIKNNEGIIYQYKPYQKIEL